MAQINGSNQETWELPNFNIVPTEFAEIGKKRIEAMVEMQKELLNTFEAINQAWFQRAKSEATLASELVTKLSAARSVPETANAYQQCMGKRMELLADDSRRLFADGQKFFSLGTRFLTNGANEAA